MDDPAAARSITGSDRCQYGFGDRQGISDTQRFLAEQGNKIVPDTCPEPGLFRLRETIIETPISQISSLEKPLRASASAAFAEPGLVTPVRATRAIATMETAPIGIALPIIAAIVPTKSASRCQALGSTPSGTGTANQIIQVIRTAIKEGTGFSGVSLFIGPSVVIVFNCRRVTYLY
ncbi:Uncharacterised protein [Morganella morganii]|nr:Uncharacterised protein [Morganella morganii]